MPPRPKSPSIETATATGDSQSNQGKFLCKFAGCDRSFIRKEHLVRHSQSHSEAGARHVCRICLKEFTRSDSLQRHAIKHGGALPNPSSRIKQACQACHASKTRCDGNEKCSKCIKKMVECVYNDNQPTRSSSQDISMVDIEYSDEISIKDANSVLQLVDDSGHGPPTPSNSRTMPGVAVPQSPENFSGDGQSGNNPLWILSGIIAKDDQPTVPLPKFHTSEDNSLPLPQPLEKRYKDLYFNYFHHRWPILHSPTCEAYGPNVLMSSIYMIGAWLHDSTDSRDFAIKMHRKLRSHISRELSKASSEDRFQQSMPAILCHAALLNVIFGLQCGKEGDFSKALVLMSTLVAILRESGFFTPEIPHEKPTGLLAYRLMRREERNRTAAYLFKIDSYISLLRGRPSLLRLEELQFRLPCTFVIHNADGLHVCNYLLPREPAIRAELSILDLIQDKQLDPSKPIDGLMLVEDIQLGLCAMQAGIWQLSEDLRRSSDSNNLSSRDLLRKKLDYWKTWLVRIPFKQTDTLNLSQGQQTEMRFYHGMEDHSEAGWEMTVFSRPKALFFDAVMLYHLLGIQLYADIRILQQLAKDYSSGDTFCEFGVPYQQQKSKREATIREWTQTRLAREALCHSSAVLVTYSNLSGLENKTVDPIAFVALSIGALVIWAYCMFGVHECEICAPQGRSVARVPSVALTLWSELVLPEVLYLGREKWVGSGGGRVLLVGTQLCGCNVEPLIARFHACLPDGWNLTRFDSS